MKKFLLNLLIPILTFVIGVGIYRISSPNVSLAAISEYTFFYNGMNVQIETYAQLESYDGNSWYIGEPFEKQEVSTYLDLENNLTNLDTLHSQLKENLSEQKFKRVKVLVKGTVKDNCNQQGKTGGSISFGCCFGRSITIKAQEVIQLEPVEDYISPE
jgi:hypothetical protein